MRVYKGKKRKGEILEPSRFRTISETISECTNCEIFTKRNFKNPGKMSAVKKYHKMHFVKICENISVILI